MNGLSVSIISVTIFVGFLFWLKNGQVIGKIVAKMRPKADKEILLPAVLQNRGYGVQH